METSNSEKFDFISKPRFLVAKKHFGNVLEKIKNDENLTELAAEFATLLNLFEICFKENLRKTHKIFEIKALDTVESKRAQSISPIEIKTEEYLKEEIKNLQSDFHKVNNERIELLKEVEELKKAADTRNKVIQVHEVSLEDIYGNIGVASDLTSGKSKSYKENYLTNDVKRIDLSKRMQPGIELKEKDDSAQSLKNNLKLLVLDLKITLQKIEELKKEIHKKDTLVKKLSKDIHESEKILAEFETKTSEICKPLETKVVKYKTELRIKRDEFQAISEALEKAQLTNEQLNVDITAKESIITDLKMKLEELEAAKASAIRNAEVFERHLGKNQNHNKELISEIQTLKDQIQSLKYKASKEIITDKLLSEIEMKEEVQSQERTIENLKSHILLRDQKLRQTEDELNATFEVLQNLKRDFNTLTKRKSNLETNITDLQMKLDDKNADMKYLNEKMCELREESEKIKRELHSFQRKHKQLIEKRDKYHNKYNHMKFVNSQQKKENAILGKRQEYLVKILKEKDGEIEKLLVWKRYIR